MNLLTWAFFQLLSYSFWWVAFIAIAFAGAKYGKSGGMFAGHIVIAIIIFFLDVAWISSEMSKPDWDAVNGPDRDIVFFIGMCIRIFLVNLTLIPLSLFMMRQKKPTKVGGDFKMNSLRSAKFRFRVVLLIFIGGLVLSGVTAFPLLAEMRFVVRLLGLSDASSSVGFTGFSYWILTVRFGLEDMYSHYPWIAYGTDWLAFGHIIIALFFVGPVLRPLESRSVLYVGILACIAVVPLAIICGGIRGIPIYWRIIDCMFGVFGVLPLIYCLRLVRIIEKTEPNQCA